MKLLSLLVPTQTAITSGSAPHHITSTPYTIDDLQILSIGTISKLLVSCIKTFIKFGTYAEPFHCPCSWHHAFGQTSIGLKYCGFSNKHCSSYQVKPAAVGVQFKAVDWFETRPIYARGDPSPLFQEILPPPIFDITRPGLVLTV